MKDKFAEYFDDHRKEMDTEEPNRALLWKGIDAALAKNKYSQKLQLWRIAAVILAFVAVGQLAYILVSQGENHKMRNETQLAAESKSSGAFETLEVSYQTEVKTLEEKVKSKEIDRSEYALLLEELDYIEEMETDFKTDIPLANDKERIAAILVDTYEKKIMLLERLLQQIDRNEKQKEKLEKNWIPLNNSNKSLSL
ncbi:hypothetical protein [Owenweeksia hongkongensis]|uniref:hypothetical protein n=1 Tax=Owenweeksia hongkongensis TaxID=253245 RepID=UPI003A8EBC25